MTMKFVIKIIIASAVFAIYKIVHFVSYVEYNALAMEQMQNDIIATLKMQAYTNILNYSWLIVAVIYVALFLEDFIKFVKWVKEKIDENH